MDFDDNQKDEKFLSANESIFEDSEIKSANDFSQISGEPFDYESLKDDSLISKFLNALSDGILNGAENRENKKLQKTAAKLFKGNEEFIKLLNDFDCSLIHKQNVIEIKCEKFNLSGNITIETDGNMLFDENSQKILYYIAKVVNHSENMDNLLNNNEDDGFYPVGNLVKQKIMLNGKETEVLTGILANTKGETKQIYYYNGKEVQPDV